MTKDQLRELADQIIRAAVPREISVSHVNMEWLCDLSDRITEAFERVQRDALAARIEWPSERELFEHEVNEKAAHGWSLETGDIYDWLRENVKIKPNVSVSGQELEDIAAEFCKRTGMAAEPFYQGWRAAEKRMRGGE